MGLRSSEGLHCGKSYNSGHNKAAPVSVAPKTPPRGEHLGGGRGGGCLELRAWGAQKLAVDKKVTRRNLLFERVWGEGGGGGG